ncbi:MAG: BlaI/MecI/CopY family transcriptional regulator [Bryobacteraceae bacterium]
MAKQPFVHLSRRERQIMDILYRRGRATAAEVREAMPESPGYSAVRAMLRVLEQKGQVKHEEKGLRYVFLPRTPPDQAKRSALAHLVDTFFNGSAEQAVAALLDAPAAKLSPEELDRMAALIENARKEER